MAGISTETLERWEERSNRVADQTMEQANKFRWFRWSVVPATQLMSPGYVLRYIGVALGGMLGLQIVAQILILPLIWSGQVDLARLTHASAPTVSVVLAAETRALNHNAPMLSGIVIAFFALNIGIIVPRAYFWNRRARRLQANPGPSIAIPDPSIWPPPPRVSD